MNKINKKSFFAGIVAILAIFFAFQATTVFADEPTYDDPPEAPAPTPTTNNSNGGGISFIPLPPSLPVNTDPTGARPVEISGGATTTTSRTVNVRVQAGRAFQMAVSNSADFSNSVFIPYTENFTWNLPEGAGTKTVYVIFRSPEGFVTPMVPTSGIPHDDILLQENGISEREVPNCSLRPGSIYKVPGRFKRYYVTSKCTLQTISSARLFYSYMNSWTQTQPTSRNILTSLKRDPAALMLGPNTALPIADPAR